MTSRGLGALKAFIRQPVKAEAEFCDLCSTPLRDIHDHLIDPRARRLLCSCQACAILFSSDAEMKYRRVPRDVHDLSASPPLTESSWAALAIPIGLAFLFLSSATGRAVAVYPSPAGPTETEIDPEVWVDLLNDSSVIARMTPDVEALLINRMNGSRDYLLVPIDECYKLTGIVRKYWRGFSGGEEGWQKIRFFFDGLKERSYTPRARSYAEPLV